MGFFTSRAVGIVVCAVVGLIGLTGLTYPLWSDSGDSPAGPVLVGVLMLAAAVVTWQARVARRDPAGATSRVTDGGEPAVVVRLRTVTPLVMTVIGGAFALGAGAAVLAVGPTDGGLLFAPVALFFGLLCVEGLHAFGRRARITLGVDTVDLRGWTLDARLAWADVQRVRLKTAGKYSRVVVEGAPGSLSWRLDRHRLLLPLDRVPDRPEIAVLMSALDDPAGLRIALDRLQHGDRAARRTLLADPGLLAPHG